MKEYTVKIPKWFTKRVLISVVLIVAAGVGCFYWGLWSTDLNGEIEGYLLAEPQEMQKGRQAGYTVMLVGNATTSVAWMEFCDEIMDGCIAKLKGGQDE